MHSSRHGIFREDTHLDRGSRGYGTTHIDGEALIDLAALDEGTLGLATDAVSFIDGDGREARIARDDPGGDPLLLEVERASDTSSFHIAANRPTRPRSRSGRASGTFAPVGWRKRTLC